MFYVYVYIDPRKPPVTINGYTFCGEPFYIGKGKEKRAWVHLKESGARQVNTLKHGKIQRIRAAGFEPAVELMIVNLTENDAHTLERDWISAIGTKWNIPGIARGPLTNMTSGGEGRVPADELRLKCRRCGEQNGMFGKTHTDEVKQRLSEFRKSFRHSEVTKAEMKRSRNSKPNPRQKQWVVILPCGERVRTSDLRETCKELQINYNSLFTAYTRNTTPSRGSTAGYKLESINSGVSDCDSEL